MKSARGADMARTALSLLVLWVVAALAVPRSASADLADDFLAGVTVHGKHLTKDFVHLCDTSREPSNTTGPTTFFENVCVMSSNDAFKVFGELPNGDVVQMQYLGPTNISFFRQERTGTGRLIVSTSPAANHPKGYASQPLDAVLFRKHGVLFILVRLLQTGDLGIIAVRGLLRSPR